MKTYNPSKWRHKLAIFGLTVIIGIGVLELVAGAMKFPNPEAMAVRERALAAQSERAHQLRSLQQGEVRMAEIAPANGI
jgi:hypothetical protein